MDARSRHASPALLVACTFLVILGFIAAIGSLVGEDQRASELAIVFLLGGHLVVLTRARALVTQLALALYILGLGTTMLLIRAAWVRELRRDYRLTDPFSFVQLDIATRLALFVGVGLLAVIGLRLPSQPDSVPWWQLEQALLPTSMAMGVGIGLLLVRRTLGWVAPNRVHGLLLWHGPYLLLASLVVTASNWLEHADAPTIRRFVCSPFRSAGRYGPVLLREGVIR